MVDQPPEIRLPFTFSQAMYAYSTYDFLPILLTLFKSPLMYMYYCLPPPLTLNCYHRALCIIPRAIA